MLLCAVFGVGTACMLLATRAGSGITPDSLQYISAARQLIAGQGLMQIPTYGITVPFIRFAPLFPVILGIAGSLFRADPGQVDYVLNGILFGANAALTAYIAYAAGRRSLWIAAAAALFMITSSTIIFVHSKAWSEPLYIFWMLLGILFLMQYLQFPALRWLALLSIVTGLAILTRYAGAAQVIGVGFVLLISIKTPLKTRLRAIIVFLVVSCAPILLWTARNLLLFGQTVGRQIVFHPLPAAELQRGLTTVSGWFFANSATPPALVPSLAGLIAGFAAILIWRRTASYQNENTKAAFSSQFALALIVLSLTYTVFLIVSISLVDVLTPLDMRILSPVYVMVVLLILYSVGVLVEQKRKHIIGPVFLLVGVIGANYLYSGSSALINASTDWDRLGYANTNWSNSPVFAKVRSLPDNTVIVTNNPTLLYFYTEHAGYPEPQIYSSTSLLRNQNYLQDFQTIEAVLARPQSIVIHFAENRPYLPSVAELRKHLPLELIEKTAIASIYRLLPDF